MIRNQQALENYQTAHIQTTVFPVLPSLAWARGQQRSSTVGSHSASQRQNIPADQSIHSLCDKLVCVTCLSQINKTQMLP